jgi:flagellar biosynthesis protein FlhA
LEDIIPENKDHTLMAVAQTSSISGLLPGLSKNSDISLAVAVVGILVFMVIPLPTMVLDLLLAFSITFSLIILLVAMYVQRPLELSAFPSILLLTTLFRLSLNIARGSFCCTATRCRRAGNIIKAFGGFVVGGNYVVGLIVFVILVVINFAGDHQGRRPHRRGGRTLHPGCHAGQADEH